MAFKVNFDKNSNKLELHNMSQYKMPTSLPIREKVSDVKYSKLLTSLGLIVFMPTDGFEEFIYKFSNTPILGNIDELPSNDSGLVGRSFRDVFPDVAEHLYPLFREVCNSGENQSLYVYIYEDDFLKDFYEINLIYDEDFFAVVLKETEKENLKMNEAVSFESNVNPICIIQDNSIVKANNPYFNLFECPKNDISCLPIETLTESHVAYNDTGLVLTYPQMIEKIMSDEFLSITYKAVINVCGTLKCFQAIARKTYYNQRVAIQNTLFKELTDFDEIVSGDNWNILQEYAKTTFVIYDSESDSYTWGKGIEELIGKKIPSNANFEDIIKPLIFTEDLDHIISSQNVNLDNPITDFKFRINTSDNMVKYLHAVVKLLQTNGGTKRLTILKDITDYQVQTEQLSRLYTTLQDVQIATSISVHFKSAEGKFFWTPETYKIIDREPRDGDEDTHIIADLLSNEDYSKYKGLLDALGPNEFLGTQVFTITTESGKFKYLEFNARPIYDKFGKFIQRSEYARDITEEVLRNQRLISLTSTVEDVQTATAISVHYMNNEGKYVWTNESYRIVGREPREGDEDTHIIADLLSEEDRYVFDSLLNALSPNEFLGNYTFPLTTESGEEKFIQVNARPIYNDDGKFMRRSEFAQDITEEVLRNNELFALNSTVEDVQTATAISVHYMNKEGKYVWTSETYKIVGREPRDDDDSYHIIADLLSNEDKTKYNELLSALGPGEFLGNYTFPLTTESGEKKFVQVNARPIYDDEGKFVRRSEYAQDVTGSVLNSQRLVSLTSTVEDVQTATAISVHYLDSDGKFVWTNESYRIVGREPRDGDEDTHIIADLLSEEDRVKFDSLIDDLGPNEFLGNYTFPLTTESGEKKFIQVNARPIYDEDGKFLRRSEFAQDITQDVLNDQQLLSLTSTVEDVQTATAISVHYLDGDGKFVWTNESYRIVGREPRDGDEDTHIIADLLSEEDRVKFDCLLDALGPNEFLGNYTFPLTTESGEKKFIQVNARPIYDEDGKFLRRSEFAQDITQDVLNDQQLLSLTSTVEDVQTATAISVHYLDGDGKFVWTNESYRIVGREPRDGDEDTHIIADLLSDEDRKKYDKLLACLGPNEFLGNYTFPIVIESGEEKFIQVNARPIYDDEGNFVRRSEFAQDVTEEVLRNNELIALNSTVEDVQTATAISVHYLDGDGKFVWTSETYKIVGREPRDDDDSYHIIADLLSDEDRKKYDKLLACLGPNEFLGNYTFPLTTESGEKKFVQVNARPIYDDDGKFMRRSEYAQDVTESVLNNQQLISLTSTVEDVQTATAISVHYLDSDGKFVWTNESYRIVGREPRNGDEDTHIIADLLSDDDRWIFDGLLDALGPNEFLGNYTFPIVTESGEKKFVQVNARPIYDDGGNFVRRSEFAQDITQDVLRNQRLISLTSTVEDVQTATAISVHYLDGDGKFVWTNESYRIVGREPREGDEDTHIIADLLSEEDRATFDGLLDALGPNEFLGNYTFPLTTGSGEEKFVQVNARPIYDEEGNFIRRSEFAQDITEEVLRNNELIALNSTVEDVQTATAISVHYMAGDGKYVWTSETYKIVGREPRDDDDSYHIIADLLSDEDKEKYENLLNNLGPGEFLGNYTFPLTTESGEKKFVQVNARPIYDDDGKFMRRSEYAQDVTESVLNNQQLISLSSTVEDVQTATAISVHYMDSEGKFVWTPETYNIIGREPRGNDSNHDIILELFSYEDQVKYRKLLDDLGPNEFLGNYTFPLTTESNEKKFVQVNARPIYDEDGNFIRRSGYAQDVTESVLKNEQLLSLTSTVEDVQAATAISVHYMDSNGKYFWTPETYKIIGREPRENDSGHNIIFELFSYEDKLKYRELSDALGPNEFLGNYTFPITTESGEEKFIQVNARPIYDDEGNFIRRSEYAQDVTESVVRSRELASLTSTVEDVQTATAISVHYMDSKGKYFWTPETYKIIGREPRDDDEDYHIIADLFSDTDKNKYRRLLKNLAPNEFLGNYTFPITIESGEEKFIQVDARPIYDDEGNFMRRSEFARDITNSVLRNRELESLNHTVEDVQTATSLSIHYLGADGKHVWTPETYKLIDREPRDSDENHHIILDLAAPDERERVQELLDNLKPNEFLGLNRTSITTESGILKYIQFDTRKTYDEEGNFVQKSGYAQDITEQVLIEREKELLSQIIAAVLNHLKIGTFIIDSEGKASLSEGFFEVTGIDKDENYVAEFENNIVTEENVVALIREFRSSDKKEFEKTIEYHVPGEEESKFLTIYMVPYYDGENELVIGAIQDVTEQTNYERDLISADKEKTVLIKEVHHRVKNNLQVITSFISLEERLRKDDPGRIIDITKKRIASLALIHERIYNEDNMNFISLKDFVHDFDLKLEALSNVPDIEFINDIDSDLSLSLDVITPLVLMINELTTNSFKYAWDTEEYADKYKEIYKSINLFNDPEGNEYCEFIFKDNGRGLNEGFDINSSPSLGWTIIKSFVSQLDGEYELFNDGLKFVLKFPLPDSK